MTFPTTRLRRFRATPALRALVRETTLEPGDLVAPLFVCPGEKIRRPISSMPGQAQLSIDEAVLEAKQLADLGVGGVILAEAINELLLPKLEMSPVGILIFIITLAIYLAVHMVSIMLAMFESFIHGARLNVVEFFGKFYKGNGIRFSQFSARRLYTQESP